MSTQAPRKEASGQGQAWGRLQVSASPPSHPASRALASCLPRLTFSPWRKSPRLPAPSHPSPTHSCGKRAAFYGTSTSFLQTGSAQIPTARGSCPGPQASPLCVPDPGLGSVLPPRRPASILFGNGFCDGHVSLQTGLRFPSSPQLGAAPRWSTAACRGTAQPQTERGRTAGLQRRNVNTAQEGAGPRRTRRGCQVACSHFALAANREAQDVQHSGRGIRIAKGEKPGRGCVSPGTADST